MRTFLDLIDSGHSVLAKCRGCSFIVQLHPNFLPAAIRETAAPQDIEQRGRCKRCGARGPHVAAEHRQLTYGGHT
ncbi:MAG: hypothetical protein COW30_03920 [Rhodospirillales bacterium CG15_BIG_FIL_POST_REV_8_21_14_020_66_15]|nr:MAG: hypothetical protein COW30_03920 [Rhodospirillales bacterium CG15_BIG_FIL_POST_REV_8_21_14_020_66_15]